MKSTCLILALLLALAAPPAGAFTPPDGFKPAIDGDGDYGQTVVVQPWDGKIVVGGIFQSGTGYKGLVRLNQDGSTDASFSAEPNEFVSKVLFLPDHSMIVCGFFTEVSYLDEGGVRRTVTRKGIVRLDSNGRPDSFDPAGDGEAPGIASAALLPDGSLVVGGAFSSLGGVPATNLARISLDPGSYGAVDPAFPVVSTEGFFPVFVIAVQDDGKVLVGGGFNFVTEPDGTTTPRQHFLRLNVDYTLDTLFDPRPDDTPYAIALQPDGKIVVGGYFTSFTPSGGGEALSRPHLARLTRSGEVDPDFAPAAFNNNVYSVALQPDGRILVGGQYSRVGGTQRMCLARLRQDGTLDSFAPVLPMMTEQGEPGCGMVFSVAVQPDGKILAAHFTGEPGRRDYVVPRFYPDGTLDADASVEHLPDYIVRSLALSPEGALTVGGYFTHMGGDPRVRVARLKPDWTLDGGFDPSLAYGGPLLAMGIQTDRKVWAGGYFWLRDVVNSPERIPNLSRITEAGTYDPETDPATGKTFYETFGALMKDRNARVWSMALVPRGLPHYGMAYVGGEFRGDYGHQSMSRFYLVRVKGNGEIDGTFNVAIGDGFYGMYAGEGDLMRVTALAIQPDGKLLVGITAPIDQFGYESLFIKRGVVLRYLPDGSPDPTFAPFVVPGFIHNVTQQRDGRVVVSGEFRYPVQHGSVTLYQNLVRLYNGTPGHYDGELDDSLALELDIRNPDYNPYFPRRTYISYIEGVALQGDGSIIISGAFDYLRDLQGVTVRDGVARVFANGVVDPDYALPFFELEGKPLEKVTCAMLQPDGKTIVGGEYVGLDSPGDTRHNLARFANPTPSLPQLTVAPDGSRVDWVRGGSAPELWGVGFEDSADGVNWTFLGNGTGTSTGWTIPLADPVRRQLRYLRARGYAAGTARQSVLVEETRMYFLKPVLTVRAKPVTRRYGDPNPALEIEYSGFDEGDDAANSLTGAAVISTTATTASAVSDYPITVSLGTLASAKYTFAVADGILRVTPAPLTVSAAAGTRVYGDPEPAVPFSATGLKNGDTVASVTMTSSAATLSPVGSAERITPGGAVFGAGSAANYEITYLAAPLTITTRPLTVRADDKYKSAGKPNPTLTASYLGLAPGEGEGGLGGVPTLSTVAGPLTPAGEYPITVGKGTISSANYSYTFVDGVMHVADPMEQTIDFPPLRPRTYGDGDFLPGAVATSSLPVSYASESGAVAGIVRDSLGRERVRVKGAGTTRITASQGGNWQYLPAESITRELIVNPPPWHGVSFDGADDVVRVPDQSQLDFDAAGSFTVETWLHLSGSQADGVGVVSKGGSDVAGYALLLQQNRIAAELSDGALSVGPPPLVGTTPLDDGLWHQVALVVDRQGGEARLYLDGRLEVQSPLGSLGSLANGGDLLAGVDRSGALHFKGEIDEVRLWKGARSREEIRSVASRIIDPADEPNLVAYYHLDEGDLAADNSAFTVAPERTSFGNDGVLSGFALTGSASTWVSSGAFAPLLETTVTDPPPPGGAICGGVIYPNYHEATQRGVCYGSDPNPGEGGTCIPAGGGMDPFSVVITGLTPGGSYHARAWARNVQGLSYGADIPFRAGKLNQTTTFPPLPEKRYGASDFPAGAVSGSPLPLSYESSNAAVAQVGAGGTIHITGAGTTTITAKQGGDGTYNAAADVPRLLTVRKGTITVKAENQSRPYKSPDPPFTYLYSGFEYGENASVISGTPVLSTTARWDSDAGGYPITIAGDTLAAANYDFSFTPGTLSITRTGQCITFPLIGEKTYGDDPFPVTAAACSGRTVSFVSSDPSVIRVEGSTLIVVGTGTVTITAREPGDGNHSGAEEVSQTVVVQRAGQQVDFSSLAQKAVGDPPFSLAASATSGLPVSYRSSDPAVVSISGSTVTIVGAGTALITASQEGDVNFTAASPVSQALTVAPEGVPPQLALSTLSSGAVTANQLLNIEGSCRDSSGIESVTLNGEALPGDLSLFSAALKLSAGTNTVTVSALDRSGNRTTERRQVVLQGDGPRLSLTHPPDNSVTAGAQLVVTGTADAGSAVQLRMNGSSPVGLALVDGAFSATATLAEGVNTIEVAAEAGGVKRWAKRSVAFAPGKPAVAIGEPGEDVLTEEGALHLRGSAAAATAVQLEVNGTTYLPALAGGVFEQQLALQNPGTYRIRATALAADGGSSVAYRTIVRIPVLPGDLNGDGVFDIGDASRALALSVGLGAVTPSALSHADVAPLVNGVPSPDGVIDVGDVLVLLRKLVGLVDF